MFVCTRGGTIVTCAATSGYMIEYDNRHLWMKLKTIKGSHFANYREAWEANRLICEGKILPPLSAVYPLDEVGEAAYQVHHNLHEGKIGVLCLAPEEGLGIDDPELRQRVGEDRITFSGGTGHERRHVDRNRPRGHRRLRPRSGHRLVPEVFGATVAHRERVESDGVEEALLAVADSYVQLLTPVRDDSTGGQVSGQQGGASTTSGTGWPTAPPRCSRSRTPGDGSSTRRPARARGGRRWPSSIPRPRSGR